MSYQYALTEFKCGNYRNAIQKFEEYLKKYPNDPDAILNIGKAHMSLKEYEKAILKFRDVIELLPTDETAWKLMTIIYDKLKDKNRAALCKQQILPEKPLENIDVLKTTKKKKILSKDLKNGLLFPLAIIDSDFLTKLYEIKQKNILYIFKHAFKLFRFKTSEKNFEEFLTLTNYESEKLTRYINIVKVEDKNLYDFEDQILTRCPQALKIKANHENENSWYKDLTLPYIFLQQDAKQIILVSDDLGLHQICKELNLNCVNMTSEKFYAYLRYKIRKTFRSFYDMWL